ncbi:unnamed protein product [Chironomus riparius]|uniref:SCP domain-containing protein n=1 Tax=Chironomus riparius TaxID=315576 RepID=A0A9N9RTR4_9DIPT|nr:unnamed protein product [Chironomus riparius]
MYLKFFLILSISFVSLQAIDYCDEKLCKRGPHIACHARDTFKSHCPHGIELVSMDSHMQDVFLQHHNSIRELVAAGKHHRGFRKAARMCSMVWDSTLAYFARLNAYKCDGEHDKCRNHPNFPSVGQNIYEGYDSSPLTAEAVIEKAINKWYMEGETASNHHLSHLSNGGSVGHFTQLVNDRACQIGCAATLWTEHKRHHFYVVCNYSFGNLVDSFAYKTKGDKCQKGYNPNHPHLCHPDEAKIIQYE